MKRGFVLLVVLVAAAVTLQARAEKAAPLGALGRMPVKEVTVFKDGHAFVLNEGKLPVDAAGNVQLDDLPTPVLGTFWPYSAGKAARLQAVVAGQRRVLVERTALSLRELIEANAGASATITETGGLRYTATLMGIPERGAEELETTAPPGGPPRLPEKGGVVLLKTQDGVKVVELARIQDVTFTADHRSRISAEEFRNLLTLKLDWGGKTPAREAEVGLLYLQRGLRWIPSYRVDLDGAGGATIKLQATLVNDLADLEDVTVNLVVGVPSFPFGEIVDPIALQKEAAELSPYLPPRASTSSAFSNAIMTQVAAHGDVMDTGPAGPELAGAERDADLYVFTVKHVTLRKSERMVLPVAEVAAKSQDRYVLELPFAPPPEIRANIDSGRQAELARLLAAPKVQHQVRLGNPGPHPFTTAPALITSQGRLLAQSMMRFTPPGASVDLDVTTAVDVLVRKHEKELKRTPNAVRWDGDDYTKVELAGTLTLTDRREEGVEVEVIRQVLGNVDSSAPEGQVERLNMLEDVAGPTSSYPFWWGWYSWPPWWSHFNGMARITWTVTLQPGQSTDLTYTWHYFWR
ncbi:MAG: hypothetical protein HY825_02030 [Acidobacteria bacterium]|nr:hypothetical protein [Acidobacteriota bacterium]